MEHYPRNSYVRLQTLMLDCVILADMAKTPEAKKALEEAIAAFKAAGGAGDNLAYAEKVLSEMK